MPRRPCSICARSDVEELDTLLRNGTSARQIALRNGIHPRLLTQHYKRHRNGLVGHLAGARITKKVLDAARKEVSVLLEAKSLFARAVSFVDAAIKADSQKDARAWSAEARECLRLLGNASGELQSGQNVTVAVGVSVERAREAVSIVEEAETLTDAALADRAVAMLDAYNAMNPNDMRTVGVPASRSDGGGGITG